VKKISKRTAGSRRPSRRPPGTRRSSKKRSALAQHEEAIVAFAALAAKIGVRWYVFGAQAVNLHGFPRATADLDVTVELAAYSTAELIASLAKAGFDARFADAEFIAATRVIPVVHRASQLPIDVVLAGPGLEQLFLDEAEQQKVGGIVVPVISIENLIVTKVLAGRPRDREDVREIVAMRAEIDHARVERRLALLERALGQSDLRTLYGELRGAAKRRRP